MASDDPLFLKLLMLVSSLEEDVAPSSDAASQNLDAIARRLGSCIRLCHTFIVQSIDRIGFFDARENPS